MSTVRVNVSELGRTDLALLVTDGERDAWVPFSQLEEIVEERTGHMGLIAVTAIVVPDWVASEKGLQALNQDEDTLDLFGEAP